MSSSRAWFEKDFYAILGVAEDATSDQIKRAYKKLAQKYHPDRNPGDEAAENKMKDASEAYDVLSDDAKRAEYDQVRRLARSGYAGGAPGQGWDSSIHFEDIPFDLGDLFGGMFGRRGGSRRGADVEARARISFDDALRGSTLSVSGPQGDVKVRIPAGIRDGARIRVRGQGAPGSNGERGDLFVAVEVQPHPTFGRAGDDITVTVPITFPDAALGALVTVETPLDGSVRLKIPTGTSSGKTFRVRGKGAPRAKGGRGDLLVTVQIDVPQSLTIEERELIERLAEVQAARADQARGPSADAVRTA